MSLNNQEHSPGDSQAEFSDLSAPLLSEIFRASSEAENIAAQKAAWCSEFVSQMSPTKEQLKEGRTLLKEACISRLRPLISEHLPTISNELRTAAADGRRHLIIEDCFHFNDDGKDGFEGRECSFLDKAIARTRQATPLNKDDWKNVGSGDYQGFRLAGVDYNYVLDQAVEFFEASYRTTWKKHSEELASRRVEKKQPCTEQDVFSTEKYSSEGLCAILGGPKNLIKSNTYSIPSIAFPFLAASLSSNERAKANLLYLAVTGANQQQDETYESYRYEHVKLLVNW